MQFKHMLVTGKSIYLSVNREFLQAFSFDDNPSHSWKLWLKYFDCHLAVTEKDSKSDKIKTYIFLTYIGQKGRKIYETSRNELDGLRT